MNRQRFQGRLWILLLLVISVLVFWLIQILTDDSLEDQGFDHSQLSLESDGNGAASRNVISTIESEDEEPGTQQRVLIDDIDPTANSYMGIKGRIIDVYTNQPIMSATLWYCKSSEGSLRKNLSGAKTRIIRDHKGIVRLYDLEPGTYSIALKARGFETYFEEDLKVPQRANFHLFKMSRGTFIEGRVLSSDGQAAANIPVFLTVELENPEDQPPARRAAQSDAQGKFLFGGLPPGSYILFLKSMQHPLAQTSEIYLSKGGQHTQDLYMPPLHSVEFAVYDSFSTAVVHANVRFYEKTMKASFHLKTDYYGKARCDFVPPGDYSLRISKNTFKQHIEDNFTILPGSDIIRISRVLEKGRQ